MDKKSFFVLIEHHIISLVCVLEYSSGSQKIPTSTIELSVPSYGVCFLCDAAHGVKSKDPQMEPMTPPVSWGAQSQNPKCQVG